MRGFHHFFQKCADKICVEKFCDQTLQSGCVPYGKVKEQIQVFAVGINLSLPVASVKLMLGWTLNPSGGSSSAQVVNINMWAKVIAPLLPPGTDK